MRPVCAYTDFFVVCSGQNPRQTKAIVDEVRYGLKHGDERLLPHRRGRARRQLDRRRLHRRCPPRLHARDPRLLRARAALGRRALDRARNRRLERLLTTERVTSPYWGREERTRGKELVMKRIHLLVALAGLALALPLAATSAKRPESHQPAERLAARGDRDQGQQLLRRLDPDRPCLEGQSPHRPGRRARPEPRTAGDRRRGRPPQPPLGSRRTDR